MKRIKWILLVILVVSCGSNPTKYYRHELSDQILTVMPGYVGKLTNRGCEGWDSKGLCNLWVVKEYDMSDAKIRDLLRALDFICIIGGRLFLIDKDRSGFFRNEYRETIFGNRKIVKSEYMDSIIHYDFLLAAKTKCHKLGAYPIEGEL